MLEIITVSLLVLIFLQEFFNRKERQKLVEALIARNLRELGDLETTRKFKPTKTKKVDDSAVPVSGLDDKTFDRYIKDTNELKEDDGGN